MRFNHMELTFPPGTMTPEFRADVTAFYGDVFGWEATDTRILGQTALLLKVDPYVSQFVLLAENSDPMRPPAYDHLGLLVDTREEVDGYLAACDAWQAKDDRVEIKRYDDLITGTTTVHAFYVRYLLPIHFDVQCQEREPTGEPRPDWAWIEP